MGEIEIKQNDYWNFEFKTPVYDSELLWDISNVGKHYCNYCRYVQLDKAYIYIINQLKEAGLLDKDYKLICCYCKLLKDFGLLHIRQKLTGLRYLNEEDIMLICFSFYREYIDKSENCFRERIDYDVRIYDYSKWF